MMSSPTRATFLALLARAGERSAAWMSTRPSFACVVSSTMALIASERSLRSTTK